MRWLNRSDFLLFLVRYSHLLAEHPYTVLLSVASVFVTLITLPFITHKFPDFSDPQLGFESRGTKISNRLTAWDNLVEATRTSGPLTLNPSELYHHDDKTYKLHFSDGRKKGKIKFDSKGWGKKKRKITKLSLNKSFRNSTPISVRNVTPYGRKEEMDVDEDDEDYDDLSIDQGSSYQTNSSEEFFCGEPSSDYARVVLSSTSGENLFTHGTLLSMCRFEHEILIGHEASSDVNIKYRSLCQPSKLGVCCRSWSIPNYVAHLANHSSCMSISEEDVKHAIIMLRRCAPAYYKHGLSHECDLGEDSMACQPFPDECLENNWAYNIFHFLADKDFLHPGNSEEQGKVPFLRYAMIFLPMACSTATMPYYSAIKGLLPMKMEGIQVNAMELGLRDSLFDQHLIQDSWLLIGVAIAIGACMWLYSSSYLIAVAAIVSIPLSLGLSYTAYKYIFQLSFFPFLNMVAAVISLGIGVDDAFIFCKMWKFLKHRAASSRMCRTDRDMKPTQIELQNRLLCLETNVDQSNVGKSAESNGVELSVGDESVSLESQVPNELSVDSSPTVENSHDCDIENISKCVPNTQETDCESGAPKAASQREDVSYHLYNCSKHGSEEWLVCETLRRSFQSMFVTSFTTAAAFYFSYFSKVTAIRCFSIFAGTAVITNFVLMLTWFPAAVVIAERWVNQTCVKSCEFPKTISCVNPVSSSEVPPTSSLLLFPQIVYKKFAKFINNCDTQFTFSKQWALIWVISLGLISVSSVVIATYSPGLHPPNELQFQLLHSSHLFERYQLVFKSFFNFEQDVNVYGGPHEREFGLPLRFVFGVLPLDQGDPLDPSSRVPRGHEAANLHLSEDFDLSSRQGQTWLLNFCQSIRSQTFYGSNSGPLLSNCFIETFKKWMSRRCIEPIDLIDRTPCCETSNFPFARKVFRKCLLRALAQLHKTPHLLFFHKGESAGPRFLKTKPHQMVAAVIEYESRIPFTTSFNAMDEFFNSVESWMSEQMKTAPKSMKCGWFVSNFDFYDLQRTLSTGVLSGVCISLGVSALTLLVFTCNILRSTLTAFSIASTTSVTLATLSLLGWSLGPVESLTLSLAVGLSADFALHYAICHRQNAERNSKCIPKCKSSRFSMLTKCRGRLKSCCRVQESNEEVVNDRCSCKEVDCDARHDEKVCDGPFVGVPATLAAITTALAGALMLPSSVVAYTQVGVFLIVLMATSWFYSTFFLLSLLRLFQAF